MVVWRVGFFAAPCEFTPTHLCPWNHRYDDPKREYRTIYSADERKTCLREVLADLRPNKKVLADFGKLFGKDDVLEDAGKVTAAWRGKNVLTSAKIVLEKGKTIFIEDAAVLKRLSKELATDLNARGYKSLDVAIVRSKDRDITRAASRFLA